MNRPPRPTKYKHGDVHEETGRIFAAYVFVDKKWYEKLYHATSVIDAQIEIMYRGALRRAKEEHCPFDIDIPYLKSIATNLCPVFGIVLSWGVLGNGFKTSRDASPSLDKILPEYGYVKGNVCIISYLANKIKQDVGYEELFKLAEWLKRRTEDVKENVKPDQLTYIPTKSHRTGKNDTQLSFVLTPGTGEDSDDFNDYRGATQGENSYRSAKEGSGVSVGHRGAEVGTPMYPEGFEDPWDTSSTVGSVNEWFERVRSQSRELDLAVGTARKIRQFGD